VNVTCRKDDNPGPGCRVTVSPPASLRSANLQLVCCRLAAVSDHFEGYFLALRKLE
jgi:hypothetical protein